MSGRGAGPRTGGSAGRSGPAPPWLARGVDPVTVQTWMGHSSIATTNVYLHHLGSAADRAGLDRLNTRGHAGGTREPDRAESQE